MEALLVWVGRLAGLSGVVVCAVAIVLRLTNNFLFRGFQVTTLAQAGTAAMILGCLCFTAAITERLMSGR